MLGASKGWMAGALCGLAACSTPVDRGLPETGRHTVSYVVSEIRISMMDWGRQAPGFDLDGMATDGTDASTCETASIDSEWGGRQGIDAVLNTLVPSIEGFHHPPLEQELARAIAERRIAVAIQLRGVAQHGDGLVEVALLALDPEDAASVPRDAEGRPLPGAIVRGTELAVGRGSIVGTRVHVRFDPFSIAGADVPYIPFEELGPTDMGFDIVRTDDGPALVHGVLGTSFAIDALMNDLLERLPEATDLHRYARSTLRMMADIDPMRRESLLCSRVSAGFEIEAVPAVVDAE